MSVGIQFGGPDRVSIATAKTFPSGLFISHLVDNYDQNLQSFLVGRYFTDGVALFGRESVDELNDFRQIAGLVDAPDREIYEIIRYWVQRLRNYGHVETLVMAEIERARSVGGSDDCPDRRKISLVKAKRSIDWFRSLSHEQYAIEVYGRNLGFPPYNVACECRIEGIIAGIDYSR